MRNAESDQMMALLQELSMLKEADTAFEANPKELRPPRNLSSRLNRRMEDDAGKWY
jgi:hypothetical protein